MDLAGPPSALAGAGKTLIGTCLAVFGAVTATRKPLEVFLGATIGLARL